ncbi:MAG: EutN/CcmL family microcompartment protein [Coleofasciculaceae cyanobacterium SM2_1_6]|jgi:carbon dioxide concentrating mechanism protein CcmL|nr:EutN/CcmL family microcompartment protein [Coleofasciculaceae cyanobacterium SM2_1_6]
MQIAKVRGTVVSTHKDPSLRGSKFLLLQLLDEEGNPSLEYEVAADAVGAGVGEWVLVTRGSAARQISGMDGRPIDALIVAIIDTVTVDNNCSIYNKKDEDR